MKNGRLLIGLVFVTAGLTVFWLTRPAAPVSGGENGPLVPATAPGSPSAAPPPPPVTTITAPPGAKGAFTPTPRPRQPNGAPLATGGSPPANPAPAFIPGSVPPPADAHPPDLSAEIGAVQSALRDFRTALGGNPVGTNAEITKSLLGDNLKQIKIPVPTGSQLNGQGELCDHWGTPYFFHQLSAARMEIRSAGPDRQMWTPDDVQQ